MTAGHNIIDKFNVIGGVIVSVLSYFLGARWYIFVFYLIFNVCDWVSGCIKARLKGVTSSAKGLNGVIKKLGYWLIILVAFLMSAVFIELGKVIGMDLGISTMIGWFVVATLMVNEIRSIVENFVEAGYNVPAILSKGLEVAQNGISSTLRIDKDESDETSDEDNDSSD